MKCIISFAVFCLLSINVCVGKDVYTDDIRKPTHNRPKQPHQKNSKPQVSRPKHGKHKPKHGKQKPMTYADIVVSRQMLKNLLPSNPVIVEAGAHYGEDTAWMSDMWPHGFVYAFEPLPPSYDRLVRKIGNRANVTHSPLALSDTQEQTTFYEVLGNDGSSSLLKPNHVGNKYKAWLVQTTTLDQWCAEHNVSHVDFLWFDMEGNELRGLKGAQKILKTVSFIYSEINLKRFWQNTVLYHELSGWLVQRGFKEVWSQIIPNVQGNVLYHDKTKRSGAAAISYEEHADLFKQVTIWGSKVID